MQLLEALVEQLLEALVEQLLEALVEQLLEALVEIGRQQNQRGETQHGAVEKWGVRSGKALLTSRDDGNGPIYHVTIDDQTVGLPGREISTLFHHSLVGALDWLVQQGKSAVLFGDEWQFTDPDELL